MKFAKTIGRLLLPAFVLVISIAAGGAAVAGSNEVVIHRFGGPGGARPFSGLVADGSGNLFGTTYYGGQFTGLCVDGCGTVFELSKSPSGGWSESVIHAFTTDSDFDTDGVHPWGGVVVDGAGDVFGTTQYGGSTHQGIVFEFLPGHPRTESILYNFQERTKNGLQP